MKHLILALLGGIAVSISVAACGQPPAPGAGPGAAAGDSPEAVAIRYRQGVMRAIEWKVRSMRGMVDGETPANDTEFAKAAADLATLAGMIPEGFIPNSAGNGAQPDIWTNWDAFVKAAADFKAGTDNLATAAKGGVAAGRDLVAQVGRSCRDCHTPYRRRQ